MSLKIIKCEPRLARVLLVAAAVLCAGTAWYFVKWNFANVVASRLDVKRVELKPVADWLIQSAPNDPQTHFSAARLFEKTFDAGDLERSLNEYEMAVALSPNNFMLWVALGKARNLNGDSDGALAAYKRALDLAPNYASVQWAYGNALIRQGQADAGFPLVAKAAASNSEYAQPAVLTALQLFGGDIEQVRRNLGNTDVTNAALVNTLSGQGNLDEAFDAWSKLSSVDSAKIKQLGESLIEKFAAAKRFRLAANVASSLQNSQTEKPMVGQIANGGFENGVKMRNAALFDWQIAEGAQPEIGLSEGRPYDGKYCLLLMFRTFETAAFRSVSQTISVEPDAEYEFEVYYQSDLKTSASLRWEIVDAMTTLPIASTQSMTPVADWTPLNIRFKVPADSDGIIIRLVREGCNGPSCPVNGNLLVDDIAIRRI